MDVNEVANVLDFFASCPRAFCFGELLGEFLSSDVDLDTVQLSFKSDSRFIWLCAETADKNYFMSKRTLFRWFSDLNLRLAQAHQARMSERRLATVMSFLRLDGRWETPPVGAVRFGRRFGFVGPAYTSGQYVFPLALVLSFLPLPSAKDALDVIESFWTAPLADKQKLGPLFERLQRESVQEGLSKFDELGKFDKRVIHIVRSREGLSTGSRIILEELGRSFGVSRERVRQIESKFWGRLKNHPKRPAYIRPFLVALLCDIMKNCGSLIINVNFPDVSLRRFVAKCAGIPQVEFELPHAGLVILGHYSTDLKTLKSSWRFPAEIEAENIVKRLESRGHLSLIESDVKILAESITRLPRKRLTTTQRVYLVLSRIGRPAHYSKITEVHNFLFPDYLSTESNIHSALGCEQHSVVWIGIRGTFALKEWGYEHPSKGLFDTVTEIVEEKHRLTGKPVPFAVIVAEIGKYRQVVNPSSLTIAAHCNPNLLRIFKDSFIPKEPGDQAQEEISADELDKVLRQFEKRSKGK